MATLTETMYIRFNTSPDSQSQSRDYWTRILGRLKFPQDVTEFSFTTMFCPNNNSAYLILTEPTFSRLWPSLTAQEQTFVTANMVNGANNVVQACFAAQPQPRT